ncbi:MAG TPA: hypothetical protein VHD14_11890 [Pseudolabrys sp.]|jgi:hypothetical protein|nr:hypothetical protein [Pseudolabrys sp.]
MTHGYRSAAFAAAAVLALLGGASFADETNPGYNPNTGQINPGSDRKTSMTAPRPVPSPEQALAAFKATGRADGQPVIAGATPDAPGALAAPTADNGTPPPGSTRQTVPAKYSKNNDTLDRVPFMAWPLGLTDEQRQRVYQAVMADKGSPAPDSAHLAPANELPIPVALNDMHPLPPSIGNVERVQGLKYVKTKDKVFLVVPANRIVVAEIRK